MNDSFIEGKAPHPGTYWAVPGRLLAGEYPREPNEGASHWRLRRLLEAGVGLFVNLTEPGEFGLRPYQQLLAEAAESLQLSCEYQQWPVRDKDIPSSARMVEILDAIDDAIAQERAVYVHCYAGIGRTGTVVGCYLIRHGMAGEEALAHIATRRSGMPYDWVESPETVVQRSMVLNWPQGG